MSRRRRRQMEQKLQAEANARGDFQARAWSPPPFRIM